MYYSKEIIERIGSDKDLALRLDRAVAGVKDGAIEYLNNLGDATTRLLYYTSCFTDNYQDVCKRLSIEDKRFVDGIYQWVTHRDIIFRMIRLYIETLLNGKSEDRKINILEKAIHITTPYSIKQISKIDLLYAVAKYICIGNKMNSAVHNAFINKIAGKGAIALFVLNTYSLVQHAADSANRLKNNRPLFYHALYMEHLEMMYFLIEPVITKSGYFNIGSASDDDITEALIKMMK
jgi:hypothetical protein